MRHWLRRGSVHRDAIGAIIAGLASQVALVLSGVLFARLLGPEGRGDLALLLLLPAVVFQVGNLGLPNASAYYIAQQPERGAAIVHRLRGFASIQAVVLVVAHAVAIGIVIWPRDSRLHLEAAVTLLWTPALLVQEYGLGILQGQRRFGTFNVLRTVPAFLYAIAATCLLVMRRHDVLPVLAVLTLLISIHGGVTLLIAISRLGETGPGGRAPTLRQLIVFGLKGVLGSSYPVETFRLDQLVVGLFLSSSDLGLYLVALSFINLPRFISQSLSYIAYPYIAAEHNHARQRAAVWRFFWVTIGINILVVLGLELVLAPLVAFFFGDQFAASVPAGRVLLVAVALLNARRILAEGMKGAGYPAAGSIAEVVSFVILIPAFLLLARSLHLVGVGVALAVSAAVSLVVLLALYLVGWSRPSSVTSEPEALHVEETGSVSV
jgi:O-antigen/teichoic acid export membrane protein